MVPARPAPRTASAMSPPAQIAPRPARMGGDPSREDDPCGTSRDPDPGRRGLL